MLTSATLDDTEQKSNRKSEAHSITSFTREGLCGSHAGLSETIYFLSVKQKLFSWQKIFFLLFDKAIIQTIDFYVCM